MSRRKNKVYGIAVMLVVCLFFTACRTQENSKSDETDKNTLKVEKEDKDQPVEYGDIFDSEEQDGEADVTKQEDKEDKDSDDTTSTNSASSTNNTSNSSNSNEDENNNNTSNNNESSETKDNESAEDEDGVDVIISDDTNQWGPIQ